MNAPERINLQTATDWIRWKGGRCPEHPETLVYAWLKGVGATKRPYPAGSLDWGKRLDEGVRLPGSVLGYRLAREDEL